MTLRKIIEKQTAPGNVMSKSGKKSSKQLYLLTLHINKLQNSAVINMFY